VTRDVMTLQSEVRKLRADVDLLLELVAKLEKRFDKHQQMHKVMRWR